MYDLEKTTNLLVNSVPVDEQAIEQIEVFAPLVVMPSTLDMAVPEDEQAVNDEECADALSTAREKGIFSEHFGMSSIKGVLDDRLYAAHRIDKNGNHFFDFCEKYSDGTFSPKMTVAQADLYMLQMYNSIKKDAETEKKAKKNTAKDAVTAKMQNKATNFLMKLTEEYLMKFRGDEKPLDLSDTLNALMAARSSLHAQDNRPKVMPAEEFYSRVVQHIKATGLEFEHRAYYALDNTTVEHLAKEMKMNKLELLRQLKEYNFLYLTESSRGYQTNVRFKIKPGHKGLLEDFSPDCCGKDSYTEWSYCIYKMEFLGNTAGK